MRRNAVAALLFGTLFFHTSGVPTYWALLDRYQSGDANKAVADCVRFARRDLPRLDSLRSLPPDRLRAVLILHIEAILKGGDLEVHGPVVRAVLNPVSEADPSFARSAVIVFASALLAFGDPLAANTPTLSNSGTDGELLLLAGSVAERKIVETVIKAQSQPWLQLPAKGDVDASERDPARTTSLPREKLAGMLIQVEGKCGASCRGTRQ